MNITLDRKKLLESITKVHSIVEKKNVLPILEHVKITISNGFIIFTTTDLLLTIQDSFQIDCDYEISFTVAVQLLYDISKKITNSDKIAFDLNNVTEGSVEIIAGHSKIIMPCLCSKEFPSFEDMINFTSFTIAVYKWRKILLKTRHAMASGEMRYYLNGIHLNTNTENTLTAVATDVHRLAISSTAAPTGLVMPYGVIIPKKTVAEIIKLTDGLDDKAQLEIHINENRISITVNRTTLTSKLINGQYPNYTSIFAIKANKQFIVDVKTLIHAVELVSAIAEGKLKIITVKLKNNSLIISIDNTKNGKGSSAQQELEVESTMIDDNTLEDIEISFLLNAKYLLDILTIAASNKMTFKMSSAVTPIIITDTPDSNCTYILMPMAIDVNR